MDMSADQLEQRRMRMMARMENRYKTVEKNQRDSGVIASDRIFAQMKAKLETILEQNDCNQAREYFAEIQQFLTENQTTMSNYDSRRAFEALAVLKKKLENLHTAAEQPFTFRKKAVNRSNETRNTTKNGESGEDVTRENRIAQLLDGQMGISERTGEMCNIIDCFDKDVLISNMTDCKVNVLHAACTIHLAHLRNCVVLARPVRTSIFVDDCVNVQLVVACQQLRMHNSRRLQVYTHVTSSAVIEQSNDIEMAPYALNGVCDEDMAMVGLDISRNNWDKVADFDWLVNDKPSPNWSVIPIDQRQTFTLQSN